jgi:hypothetical protein
MLAGLFLVLTLPHCTGKPAETTDTATSTSVASAPAPATPAESQICAEQKQGTTSDGDAVIVCQKLFPSAPYVRVPQNESPADGTSKMTGVVELDISQRAGSSGYSIQNSRFYDRDLNLYDLVDEAGKPIDEKSPLMQKNHLPSNRVHFIVYEATGKVLAPSGSSTNSKLQLTDLRAAILVEGQAIDSRFLGPWEGIVSKRRSPKQWYADIDNPEHVAKIRVTFAPPTTPYDNIGEVSSNPKLADGTRSKTTGKFDNATQSVRLSTGECAPALNSYGDANPFPEDVKTSDYSIDIWRFPAMHTLWSKDFHIVFTYPKGLNPYASAMARDHNFRLKDYIATSTQPKDLVFGIHANPVDQILFSLKPVTGGGGACT